MAAILVKKMFAAFVLVVVALSWAGGVSAQTHHVVVGDDVSSWLSGRVFRVGDKILFKTEESIVELPGLDEFLSCDITNPIRMFTDKASHVPLEKEGVRYFTSSNLESCKNGLKLPVSVEPFGPAPPHVGPHPHVGPPHSFSPPPHVLPPPFEPPPHAQPPVQPHPAFVPPPPPPPPSAAINFSGFSLVLFAGLLLCYVGL